jgi:hypothetical protein
MANGELVIDMEPINLIETNRADLEQVDENALSDIAPQDKSATFTQQIEMLAEQDKRLVDPEQTEKLYQVSDTVKYSWPKVGDTDFICGKIPMSETMIAWTRDRT